MTTLAATKLVVLLSLLIPAASGAWVAQKPVRTQAARQQAGREQEIFCPVKEVRTAVTTPVPKPWWNTPQEGGFQSAGVQEIGGKQTLVCRYMVNGTVVSLMRLFPEGIRDCRAAGNHFVCR